MPFYLGDVTQDPEMASCFTVLRTTGIFAAGGWQKRAEVEIQMYGVVAVADDEALSQVPEGDRVTGSLQILTDQPLYETLISNSGISDKVFWNGNMYRVISRQPWTGFGYWSVIVSRMTGG
jgi:hypothetical protein